MDDTEFCEALWEIIDPMLTAKQKPRVANQLADLLDSYGVSEEAVLATDWYANHAGEPCDNNECEA